MLLIDIVIVVVVLLLLRVLLLLLLWLVWLLLLLLWLLLLLAVVASAAAGVVRFLCWHVLKLESWHFAHPELNFASAFASVLRCFIAKTCPSRRAALCKNVLTSAFRIFFRCFPVCIAFCMGFSQYFADSRLSAHAAWTCISLSALFGGWRGDDVHANAPFVFSFLCARAGAVHLFWCGTYVKATSVFSFFA